MAATDDLRRWIVGWDELTDLDLIRARLAAGADPNSGVRLFDKVGGCCCGWDGRCGPNLACARCDRPVATRVDDCGFWQVVWLEPDAVRPVAVAGPVQRMMDWTELPSTAASSVVASQGTRLESRRKSDWARTWSTAMALSGAGPGRTPHRPGGSSAPSGP